MGLTAKFQFVISPTSTGKTEMVLRLLKKTDKEVIFIYARRSLVAQCVGRSGVRHYEDVADLSTFGDSVAITVDSLHKLDAARYKSCIVVLDEIGLTIEQIFGKTNQKNLKSTLSKLKLLLHAADKVIVLESSMTENSIRFVKQAGGVTSDDEVYTRRNDYSRDMGTAYRYKTKNALKIKLLKLVGAGKRLAVAMDSGPKGVKAMERFIQKRYPAARILTVHSESDDEVLLKILADPEVLREYDVLIYSPTLFTGADISFKGEGHFDAVIGFRTGKHISPRNFAQACDRVRDIRDRELHLYTSDNCDFTKPVSWEAIYKEWQDNKEKVMPFLEPDTAMLKEEISLTLRPLLECWADIQAEENLMNRAFSACLDALLERKGYKVVGVDEKPPGKVVKAVVSDYSEAVDEVKEEHVQAVLSQPRTPPDEAEKLSEVKQPTENDRLRLERFYAEELNGFSEDGLEEIVRKDPNKVRLQVHRHEATRMSDDELGNLQRNLNAELQVPHLRDVYHSAKLRQELLNDLGGVEQTGILDTEKFMDTLRSRRQEVNKTLGMDYTHENVVDPKQVNQTVNRFLKTLGLETAVSGRQQVDGKRVRSYKIDPQSQGFILGILERRKAYKERAAREKQEQEYHEREQEHNEMMDRAINLAKDEAVRQGVPYNGRVSFAYIEQAKQFGGCAW